MKGIIPAGGKGTRLAPTTSAINKHLIPIYNKPMIYYPVSLLIGIGVRDLLITSHAEELPIFQNLLGDGSKFGIKISYKVQKEAGGIAEVLLLAEDFIGEKEKFVMCLGDNIFHISHLHITFSNFLNLQEGAGIILCPVKEPSRFGVAEINKEGVVTSVVEKPKNPSSNLAITGLYFYDKMAIQFAKTLKPSNRGELEITDINMEYLKLGKLHSVILSRGAVWFDTGTFESLFEASEYVRIMEIRRGQLIGSPEEIAFHAGLITKNQLKNDIIDKKGEYYEYLMTL